MCPLSQYVLSKMLCSRPHAYTMQNKQPHVGCSATVQVSATTAKFAIPVQKGYIDHFTCRGGSLRFVLANFDLCCLISVMLL